MAGAKTDSICCVKMCGALLKHLAHFSRQLPESVLDAGEIKQMLSWGKVIGHGSYCNVIVVAENISKGREFGGDSCICMEGVSLEMFCRSLLITQSCIV